MKQETLGSKIKKYRKRAEMSQLELEIAVDLSHGSISRIENNKVNPSKETLVKIANLLNLNIIEASNLFNFDSSLIIDIIHLVNNINEINDLDEFLQKIINKIVFDLNFLGGIIGLIDQDKLRVKAFTQTWYSQFVINTIPYKITDLYVDINDQSNYFYDLIHHKKVVCSERLHDFAPVQMSKALSDVIQKFTKQKAAIAVPLEFEDNVIGAIYLTKQFKDDFSFELPIIKELASIIASKISQLNKSQ